MLLNRNCILSVCLFTGSIILPGAARAADVSLSGMFSQDDQIQYFTIGVTAPETVTFETLSYGGGVNAQGMTIPGGGFEPVLSLFSGSGTLMDVSGPDGNCPPQTADAATGLCVDAYLQETALAPGDYTLALTEFFNVPNGPDLSDGFLEQGHGNFTGPEICSTTGSFLDETCSQRTSSYALDVLGAQSAVPSSTTVPEPGSIGLIASGAALLATGLATRLRRRGLK